MGTGHAPAPRCHTARDLGGPGLQQAGGTDWLRRPVLLYRSEGDELLTAAGDSNTDKHRTVRATDPAANRWSMPPQPTGSQCRLSRGSSSGHVTYTAGKTRPLDTAPLGMPCREVDSGRGGRAMLVELSVKEQRYHAVMEVLSGAPVTEVARRYGVSRRAVHALTPLRSGVYMAAVRAGRRGTGMHTAAMGETEWSHLQDVVDALTAAGNAAEPPGFHPTQGGWVCEMTRPLDATVASACATADPRLTYQNDELSCSHCWAVIMGRNAREKYAGAYRRAHRHEQPGGNSGGCDLCNDAWLPYINRQYIRLASDAERHAELCQCPRCGSLYQVFPEDLTVPAKLTLEQVRRLFPGAL